MKYFGLSEDENILFTDEKIIVLKENDGKKSIESFLYGPDSFVYILQAAKSGYRRGLMEGSIDSISYITSPRKFLLTILETFEFEESFKMNMLIEWDKKFSNTFGLLSEGVEGLSKSSLINESWDYINILSEQLWDYLGRGAKALGNAAWGAAKAVGSAAWQGAKAVGSAIGSGLSYIAKGLSYAAQQIIMPILKSGVLPFLRWIRRNLNTYMGMIVDVVASLFPTAIVLRIIWGLIVMMDIYEILFDDYDPKDPERKQSPFLYLITDIISLLFTSAVGMTAKVGLKAAMKTGVTSGPTKKILGQLIESLPKLKGILDNAKSFITKVFGQNAGKFMSSVFNGIDTVITKLLNFIKTTFKFKAGTQAVKQTGKELATKKGFLKAGLGTAAGFGLAELMKEKTLKEGDSGPLVKQAKQNLLTLSKAPEDLGGVPKNIFNGPVNDKFDSNFTNSIKKLQSYYKQPVTGKIDPAVCRFSVKKSMFLFFASFCVFGGVLVCERFRFCAAAFLACCDAPFLELQDPWAGCRFSSEWSPPNMSGTMWSAVEAPGLPHRAQMVALPSLNSCLRLAL